MQAVTVDKAAATKARLPDFIAVGPPRTATTWLHEVLSGHVGLPAGVKETEFFLRYYDKGIDWYRDLFRDCSPGLPAGEICPTYFASSEVRNGIAREIPNCKIIVTLRDPVERLYSHYRLLRREAWIRDHVTLEQAIERHLKTSSGAGNMFDMSRYAFHVKAWQETFGERNVLILFNDDLDRDPQSFVAATCAFIGIPEIDLSQSSIGRQRVNSIAEAPRNARLARIVRGAIFRLRARKLYRLINSWDRTWLWKRIFEGGEQFARPDASLEARLRAHFRPEIEALENMTGRDLSAWKGDAPASSVKPDIARRNSTLA